MQRREFLLATRIEAHVVEAWIEAGWLLPSRDADVRRFSDADMARAQLIRDLQQDLGVNEEGVSIILDLIPATGSAQYCGNGDQQYFFQ